jgi:hypothetical protein
MHTEPHHPWFHSPPVYVGHSPKASMSVELPTLTDTSNLRVGPPLWYPPWDPVSGVHFREEAGKAGSSRTPWALPALERGLVDCCLPGRTQHIILSSPGPQPRIWQ